MRMLVKVRSDHIEPGAHQTAFRYNRMATTSCRPKLKLGILDPQFEAAHRKECLKRWQQGRNAWNRWARAMLKLRQQSLDSEAWDYNTIDLWDEDDYLEHETHQDDGEREDETRHDATYYNDETHRDDETYHHDETYNDEDDHQDEESEDDYVDEKKRNDRKN